MYTEGQWIIDKKYKLLGTVTRVFPDGVTVRYGGLAAIRHNDHVEPAPLDIQQEDIASMIDLALATKDEQWFTELTQRLEAKVCE